MRKKLNPTAEELRLYLFVVFLLELFLFSLCFVGGRFLGYKTAFLIGAGIGIVIVVCFGMIFVGNLLVMGMQKAIERTFRKRDFS